MKTKFSFRVSLSLFVFCVLTANVFAASPGKIDLGFGTNGSTQISLSVDIHAANAVAVQPDGKIIVVGSNGPTFSNNAAVNFSILRLNPNGSLDTTFGTDGKVFTDFNNQSEGAVAVEILPDGKFIVAGGADVESAGTRFKVARYTSTGALDTTFGTAGKATIDFGGIIARPTQMVVHPDGKITLAGESNTNSPQFTRLLLAQLNADGSLDNSFGTSGTMQIVSGTLDEINVSLARQTDGKLLIASTISPFSIRRFNANGSADTAFGTNGEVTANFTRASNGSSVTVIPSSIVVQPDNKFIVAGRADNDMEPGLLRFNANGTLDAGFRNNLALTQNCFCASQVKKIILLPNGKFYLFADRNQITRISRYLSNGNLDNSYGFRGSSADANTQTAAVRFVLDATAQPDGELVFVGFVQQNNFRAMDIWRVTNKITPPIVRGDFDGDGKTDFSVWRPSNGIWYFVSSINGSFGTIYYGASGDKPVPQDYDGDGKTDASLYRAGENRWYTNYSRNNFNGANSFYLSPSSVPTPADYDGDGHADLGEFRSSNARWRRTLSRYSDQPNASNPTYFYDAETQFGINGDKPVLGDFDGDGQDDLAVYRPSNGTWYVQQSSTNTLSAVQWGVAADQPVAADYDGDLKTDVAVYRNGTWFVLRSSDNQFISVSWGISNDKPTPGDYNGDGKTDYAVWRPDSGVWYVIDSVNFAPTYVQWGTSGDIPIPFAYLP